MGAFMKNDQSSSETPWQRLFPDAGAARSRSTAKYPEQPSPAIAIAKKHPLEGTPYPVLVSRVPVLPISRAGSQPDKLLVQQWAITLSGRLAIEERLREINFRRRR